MNRTYSHAETPLRPADLEALQQALGQGPLQLVRKVAFYGGDEPPALQHGALALPLGCMFPPQKAADGVA